MTLRIGVLGASGSPSWPSWDRPANWAPARGRRRPRPAAGATFAENHGVERVLGPTRTWSTTPQVDVVYNPLANALHAPWKLAAIAASKPVLTDEAVRPQSCRGAKHPRRCGGSSVPWPPATALGELRHVEVRMAMPAPDPDDPRWSLELAGGRVNGSGLLRITRDSHDEPPDGDPPGGLCCPCVAALSGRRRMV